MPLAAFPKCFLDELCVTHTMTVEQWFELVHTQLDVDGLEMHIGFVPVDNPVRLRSLKALAESYELTIPMLCYSPDFTKPNPKERQEEIEKQKRAIDASAALGGRYCRVLSGQKRGDISIGEGIAYAAECIRACIPYAAERGIVLNLENHYKDSFWVLPELAQKKEAFLELLEKVGESPNFGVNYDPSNAIVAGDDPIELLELIKHRVVSMHASDRWIETGKTLDDLREVDAHPTQGYAPFLHHGVIGQGLNDYDKIFSILAGVGFTGWVSIEDGQDAAVGMEHLRLSAEFLRLKMGEYGLN